MSSVENNAQRRRQPRQASSETRYETGGVMRCCIASLQEFMAEHEYVSEGSEVLCKYEKDNAESSFVLRGRLWKVRRFEGRV